MANFGRRICEREILSVDSSTVAYGTPPTAKERYMTLMEEKPEDVYKRQPPTSWAESRSILAPNETAQTSNTLVLSLIHI